MLLLPFASALASPVVAIVPGCPSEADGTLSHCQERRLAWVARLWESGRITNVITSGAAVYNPYVEADVMADALIALGVPADRILRERDALHTDENISWSLAIAEQHGFSDIVVATDVGQAQQGCAMVRAWSDARCTALSVDYRRVRDDLRAGELEIGVRGTPLSSWIPLAEREARIAEATGTAPRASSMKVYAQAAARGYEARPAPPPEDLRTPGLTPR